MPNWCENTVEISGSEADIKKLMELVTDDFDFDKILPMPPELEGFTSPVQILSQEEFEEQEKKYKEWLNTPKDKRKGIFIRHMTQEMSDHFITTYGYNNWYDWCVNNWGVKWNASDVTCKVEEDWVNLHFMTPWGPPAGIYDKLVELFPDISISWLYNEPGMGISGYLPD